MIVLMKLRMLTINFCNILHYKYGKVINKFKDGRKNENYHYVIAYIYH